MTVTPESPDQAEVIALIRELDDYQDTLYPPEARYALNLEALKAQNVVFMVSRDNQGRATGCGAVVLEEGYGELKRMYVRPSCRGQGIAKEIASALEKAAAQRGVREIRLETGPRQPEALAFYRKQGYMPCTAFGPYPEHPLSVFMEKRIPAPPSEA